VTANSIFSEEKRRKKAIGVGSGSIGPYSYDESPLKLIDMRKGSFQQDYQSKLIIGQTDLQD
jgi:hypothetical protein